MDKVMAPTRASDLPQEAWARWEREQTEVLERATRAQRVLREAAVRFVAVIAAQPILLGLAAFQDALGLRAHGGLDLGVADDLGHGDAVALADPGLEAHAGERVVDEVAHRAQTAAEHGAGAPGDPDRPLLQHGEREHRGAEAVAQLVREDAQALCPLIGR